MSPLQLVELVAGTVLLLTILAIVSLWARRYLIARGRPMLLCALRTPTKPQWRLGLLRFGVDRLDWFSIIGPRMSPECSWDRSGLELGAPTPTHDAIPGLSEPLTASGRTGDQRFDIAMSASGLTAMRSWTESSPPGFNVNIPGQFT